MHDTETGHATAIQELPEHVLLWEPLGSGAVARITRPGQWTLLTRTEYETHGYCPAIANWEASGRKPAAQLAAWVTEQLGYPVALDEGPSGVDKRDWIGILYGVRRSG